MKRYLLSAVLAFFYTIAIAQPPICTPVAGGAGETCLSPCWTCLNPYFGNTFNFQPMGAAINNFCPPNTALHNDQYLAFKVLCGGVGAVTFTITSNSGCNIQAAIYKVGGCGALPLQCNPGFSGTINNFGNNVNYTAGDFYMLMIDGVGGAQCFFTVTVNQPACVENPPNPFSQNWGPMSSNAPTPIPCPNPVPDVWWNLNVPVVPGAQRYHWYVKSGPATLRKTPPLQTGTTITVNGVGGATIQFNPTGVGTIEICCKATNGCDSTNEVCKTFEVVLPPNRDTTVNICSEDNTWPGTGVPNAPSPLPGAPFAPGTYAINLLTAQNCPYVFNLVVVKDQPLTKNLGDVLLCETESFSYCGRTYTGLQSGAKTFVCLGTGSGYPGNCDTTITVNIIGITMTVNLASNGTNLACPGDTKTLNACTSSFTPSGATATYKWFKDNVEITDSTNCSLVVSEAGSYKVEMTVTFMGKSCFKTKTLVITSSYPPLPTAANIPQTGPFCNNQPYTFTISNVNSNFTYMWTLNGNAVGNGTTKTLTVLAPTFTLCVKTSNVCLQDTTKCYTFDVITVPNRDTTVNICSEDATWPGTGVPNAPSPLPGAPFAPGFHKVVLTSPEGCKYDFNITVVKDPPITKNLGDILLCENESFTYCNKTYTGLQSGVKTFNCVGTGSTYPTSCDTTITVTIIGITINLVLTSNGTNLACPGDTKTLTACTSSFTPSGATVEYKWYKDNVEIPGETNCNLIVSEAGDYKVDMTVTFMGKTCFKSKNVVITSSYPPLPTEAIVPQTGPFCNNQPYTFTISNPNSVFTYSWTFNGNAVGNGTSKTVTVLAPTFTICVKTSNVCMEDTSICYTFDVISVPNRDTTVFICNEDPNWPGTNVPNAPSPLPGAPFTPGFHKVVLTSPEGCKYDFNITVNKYPPILKDLGDVILCENESFTYCNKTYTGLQSGLKSFSCAGTGSEPPESCDTTIKVNIIGMVITPILNASAMVFTCPNQTITLNACSSTATPSGAVKTYQWFKDGTELTGETNCTLTITEPGVYTVDVTATFNGKACTKSASKTITVNFPPFPTEAIVPQTGPFCNAQSYTFTITNTNPVFTYSWTLNGNPVGSGTTKTVTVNAPDFTLCVKTSNVCNEDTTICYTYPVIIEPNRDTTVFICFEDANWPGTGVPNAPSPLPGAPFAPGFHTVNLTTNEGCKYKLFVTVQKYPQLFKDIGEVVLCEAETFTYCGKTYSGAQPGKKQFVCFGYGNQPPESCDTTITLNVIGMVIKPNLTSTATNLSCPNDEILISVCNASLQPANANVTYQWFKDGNDIPGAIFCDFRTKEPGTFMVEITLEYNGKICSKTAQVNITQNYPPFPTPAQINVNGPFCNGKTYNFNVLNPNPLFKYNWFLNGVLVYTGNPGIITVSAPDDDLCIQSTNVCKEDTTVCYTLDVLDNPTQPVVSGQDTVCQGGDLQFCVLNPQPNSTYSWILPPLASIINQTSTCITVRFGNSAGTKTVCALNTNKCGTAQACKPVYVLPNPNLGNIQGPPLVCRDDYSVYSVPKDPAAIDYVWTFTGGDIINGQGTNVIDVLWTTPKDTGTICVYAIGACKDSKVVCFKAKIIQPPKQPLVLGTTFICASGTNYLYKNDTIDPNANYTWTQTGGTVVKQFKDSIVINWLNETTGVVKIAANNVCGNKTDDLDVKVYKIPTAVAGDDQKLCQFDTKINTVPSIGNGTWKIINKPSNSNASLSTNNTGTLFQSNACGVYDMEWKEDNNGCFAVDTVSINVSLPPKISGLNVICDTSKTFYTVTFDVTGCGNSFIVKNLINGSTKLLTSAPYKFVSDPLPDSSTFRFVVYGSNECVSDTIAGAKLCSCPTNAGEMSSLILSACEDGTVVGIHKANQTLQIDDTFEFILHTNPGTQLGTIIDRNKTGIFKFVTPPMILEQTYYISYVAGNILPNGQVDLLNDLCLSVAPGQPVIFHAYPKPDAGKDFTICGDSASIEAIANAPQGSWKLLTGPGVATFAQSTNSKTSVTVSNFGNYVFEWTSDNFGCKGKDDMKVSFFPDDLTVSAPIKTCDPLALFYQMQFTISGGTAPYFVNGVQLLGNQFTSVQIPAGDPYSFAIKDANDCAGILLDGVRECDCVAEAISITIKDVCEYETTQAVGTGKKGGKDIAEYLLATGKDLKLPSTKILDRNPTGLFGFVNGMTCGTTYYALYAIARPDPSDPLQVKLIDTCLSYVSQPVVFNCKPIVNAGVKDSICGQSYELNGSWSLGIGTWTALSGPGTSNIADKNAAKTKVDVSTCGLYRYELFANSKGCVDRDTAEIDYSNPPTESNRIATCNNIFTEYTVTFDINGCGGPYTVTGMTDGVVTGTKFVSNPISSDSVQYTFEITDAFGCKTVVKGSKNCQCLSTEVGALPTSLLKVCIDDNGVGFVQTKTTGGSKFDPNDTYEYILTDTCTSKNVGVIFDLNKTGRFTLVPPMQYGVQYYIAYGVGDSLPNGQLQLQNNKCLRFAWQPVIFYKCPTAKCPPPDTVYCALQSSLKAQASVGVGTWTVLSKPANAVVTIGNPNASGTALKVSEYGSYAFQWLEDNAGYRDSCTTSVNFIYIPAPGVVGQPIYTCNTKDTTYTVTYTLNSTGGALKLLSGSDPGIFAGQTFTSNPIKSDVSYKFAIKTAQSCDTLFLSGDYHCYCKAYAGAAAVSSVCEGVDTLFNLGNILQGADLGGKWESLQLINGFNAGAKTFRTAAAPAGTYLFRYGLAAKTSAPSCLGDTAILNIVVNQTPFADAGLDKLINCKVPTIELGGNQSTAGLNINYLWQGPGTTKPTSKFTVASSGGVYVLRVYNPVTGCADTDTVTVVAKVSKPEGSYNIKAPGCKDKLDAGVSMKLIKGEWPVTYKMKGVKAPWNQTWDSLDLGIKGPGKYPIELEDVNGCKAKDTIVVPEGPTFNIDLGPDFTIEFGDSAMIEAILKDITKDQILKIEWKPNVPTVPGNPLAIVVKPDIWKEYCLTIYNKSYCKAEDCVLVRINNDREVFAPNVFSPDGDGVNDQFTLYGNKNVEVIETLQIFDRWGNLMFKRDVFPPDQPLLGWDGTFRDRPMNPGVFVFWAKVKFKDGTTQTIKGDVTIIRN